MDRVGRWVGPYEAVARVWVPEPGIWYAGRGTPDEADQVLIRFGSQPDEIDELQHQHEVLRGLDDPRLPEAVRFDEDEGALVIRGGLGATLSDAVALRLAAELQLTPGTLVDLLLEVGGALAAVHAVGEVHGHLEPRCVVLEANGAVWVYGVGAVWAPSAAFLAPELARGHAATPWSDQWALGALGLALVLGHPPWRSEDPRAEATSGDLSRAVEAVTRQWPALGHVLGRMVASEPGDRFPALDEATDELAELAGLAGPSEREGLGTALSELPRPPVIPDDGAGGAPTAVPATDAEDRASDPGPHPDLPYGWDGIDDTEDDTDDRVIDGFGSFAAPRVEVEDPEVRPELTDPIGWFQGTPAPAPAPAPFHHTPISLAPERAPPPATANLAIVRLAPVLAGAMVVLLVVWLVVRVL